MSSPTGPPPATPRKLKRARETSAEYYARAYQAMLPSPPSSTVSPEAKRKRDVASTNTVSEDGLSIVQEQWRAGGPFLCLSPAATYGLEQNDAFNDLATQRNIHSQIQLTLDHYRVKAKSISGPDRRRGLYEADNDRPDRVVLVEAVKESTEVWFKAIEAILIAFRTMGWDDLNVEFMDDRAENFYLSPVVSGDKFILDWVHLKPLVMTFLNDHDMPIPWLSIDCVRRGYQQPAEGVQSPFTILITLRQDAISWNHWWIKETLEDTLHKAGGGYVVVEILRGGIFVEANESNYYRLSASVGASISQKGVHRTGTLGGYFRVQDKNGYKKHVGLTCHHVIEPKSHPDRETITCNGFQISNNMKPIIMQPSEAEHKEELIRLEELVGITELVIHKNRKGSALDIARKRNESALQEIKAREDYWISSGELGTVWCSSGDGYQRTKDDSRLDWALIDLASGRQDVKNELPPAESITGEFKQYWIPELHYNLVIPKSKDITKCKYLFKIGATSGATSGLYNGIRSVTNLDHDRNSDLSWSEEHMVVPTRRQKSGTDGFKFAQPGDSGAFVLSEKGYLAGIVFAGNPKSGVGYVTSVHDLIPSIERTIGPDWDLLPLDEV